MTDAMSTPATDRIFTVSDLTRSLRGLVETAFPFVAVCGEISNLRRPASGHCYFTLKDQGAQLRCVLFRNQQRYLSCRLTDGLAALCRGRITVYEPRGDYQMVVDLVEPAGAGALQLAFEQLKRRLAAEGLFALERKRPLPPAPWRIAVVSSPSGAAIRDFCRTARQRFPLAHIVLLPVRVQGEGAAGEIRRALERVAEVAGVEAVALCRGGGSAEDLWPFNDEGVARAIAACPLPVVTGIGHESDVTIADLVADLRAATPTAAAAALLPDRNELGRRFTDLGHRLTVAITRRLAAESHHLAQQRRLLGTPHRLFDQAALTLAHRHESLVAAMRHAIDHQQRRLQLHCQRLASHTPLAALERRGLRLASGRDRLAQAIHALHDRLAGRLAARTAALQAMNPRQVLERGYALVQTETGSLVTDPASVPPGGRMLVTLARGRMRVERLPGQE